MRRYVVESFAILRLFKPDKDITIINFQRNVALVFSRYPGVNASEFSSILEESFPISSSRERDGVHEEMTTWTCHNNHPALNCIQLCMRRPLQDYREIFKIYTPLYVPDIYSLCLCIFLLLLIIELTCFLLKKCQSLNKNGGSATDTNVWIRFMFERYEETTKLSVIVISL